MIEKLTIKILSDLSRLNLPVDEVDLFMRPYSSSFYGRYFPVRDEKRAKAKIHIYPFSNKEGEMYKYDEILETAIHEFCHHIQYSSGTYKRVRGVMHDSEFWKLFNHYVERAKKYELLGGVKNVEKSEEKYRGETTVVFS